MDLCRALFDQRCVGHDAEAAQRKSGYGRFGEIVARTDSCLQWNAGFLWQTLETIGSIEGGFIDHSGNWFIAPDFLVASDFSEGSAFASTDGECFGFIDLAGKFAIRPEFEKCHQFSNGLAAVCRDGRWGYIDHHG